MSSRKGICLHIALPSPWQNRRCNWILGERSMGGKNIFLQQEKCLALVVYEINTIFDRSEWHGFYQVFKWADVIEWVFPPVSDDVSLKHKIFEVIHFKIWISAFSRSTKTKFVTRQKYFKRVIVILYEYADNPKISSIYVVRGQTSEGSSWEEQWRYSHLKDL